MIKLSLQLLGWLIAHTPESVLRISVAWLGRIFLFTAIRRRRLLFSNLHHAFPDRPSAWHQKIAVACSQRVFETALLSLASPYLSEPRVRQIAQGSDSLTSLYSAKLRAPHGLVMAPPHMAYWECLTWLGLFVPAPAPEFGVIFRPIDNPSADAWVKKTRERFGMKLLSRKQGLQESFKILRRNGVIGILFDQNAGMQGALTTLFGRVCSTTELPGMLVEKTESQIAAIYCRRLSFWRIRYEVFPLSHDGTAAGVTLALNRWLETTLSNDEDLCASWLWSHDRWRHQDIPEKRFHLDSKRNLLELDLASRGEALLPKRTRLWIRLPNWLGDVVMAIPLLRALRVSRPDAEITLIGKSQFQPIVDRFHIADRFEPLPPRTWRYFPHFWCLRRGYPDVYLLFTHSFRGDLEAWLTRCRQRFGLLKPRRHRPLLTRRFRVPFTYDESQHHQLELWIDFLKSFGLTAEPDRSPLLRFGFSRSPGITIGFIAGSENNPEKRWPVAHWKALAKTLLLERPGLTVVLFGTSRDRDTTGLIAWEMGERVIDLAGKTNLNEYADRLVSCHLLITNDTGGMHLANSLNVPVLALFGPTNPVRTGPVFNAPVQILQPPGCPPTGGADLTTLSPETVAEAARVLLQQALVRD